MSKNTRTRILLTAVAALLLVTMAVGGTLAWLQDETEEVKNTFTPTTLSIELHETVPGVDGGTAAMVPGATIDKDPYVTYTTDVPAYVFVKVTKSDNYNTYLEDYTVAAGWTAIEPADENEDGIFDNVVVFYKSVDADNNDDPILAPESVKVKTGVTTTEMGLLYNAAGQIIDANCPTLSFEAYIIQSQNLVNGDTAVNTAEDAWTTFLAN